MFYMYFGRKERRRKGRKESRVEGREGWMEGRREMDCKGRTGITSDMTQKILTAEFSP